MRNRLTLEFEDFVHNDLVMALRDHAQKLGEDIKEVQKEPSLTESWKKGFSDGAQKRIVELERLATYIECADL